MPRFLTLLVGWARLVPSCDLKSKLEMSSILQSYWRWKVLREAKNGFKYEAVFGFEIAGAEAWNWLRSAILNLNRSMSKAKCCATWMMLALPGKPFCGCYVLFVSSCFWKSNFDLLSWGLVEKFVVGLQVVQRGCSCDGGGTCVGLPNSRIFTKPHQSSEFDLFLPAFAW